MNDLSTICPTHPNTTMKPLMDVQDYFLTQEKFNIHECPECGLIKTWPVPKDLDKYYETEEYLSHGAEKAGLFAKAYRLAKVYNLGTKARLFRTLCTNGSVLDYGCGTGDLIAHLKGLGYTVAGAEPSSVATQNAPSSIRDSIRKPDVELASDAQYDVISLFHVLEHISNLEIIVSQLKNKLKPGGQLVIAVPNPDSYDAVHYREYWAAWDVPRHLWHFKPASIISLFDSLGFHHRSSHPMWLDAFYVSLLSERYKGGSGLKALAIALRSNFMALFSKRTHCSSQIYVFSPK